MIGIFIFFMIKGIRNLNQPRKNLLDAADKGDIHEAKKLISEKADTEIKDLMLGNRPLHIAAQKGHINIVDLLIQSGAIVDAKNRSERTPLHLAAIKNHSNIIKLLIQNGADIEAQEKYNGYRPLHIVVLNGYTNTAKMLLQNGANIETQDEKNRTPLHIAAMYGKTETAKMLLQNGANIEAMDNYGRTPLHTAARYGKIEIAKMLLQNGANIEARDRSGSTPLHVAALFGRTETAKMLLQNGANIEAMDNYGNTPLHDTIRNGTTETAEMLLQNGADTEALNSRGNTPLHDAARYEETEKLLQCDTKRDELRKLLAEKDRAPHLPRIIQLLEDELTPEYDKKDAIAELFADRNINTRELKGLFGNIVFNHRFFNDDNFKEICEFAAYEKLKDRDDKTTEQNAEIFCQDQHRVAETLNFLEKINYESKKQEVILTGKPGKKLTMFKCMGI